jgi:hypothetical protein
MKRQLAAIGLVLALATASWAQAPGWNPWWNGGVVYPPQQPGIQYLGQLPNGIPVFNPWNMYQNLNNQRPVWYGSPYGFSPLYYNALYANPYLAAYGFYNQGFGSNAPVIQRESGRFVPVARDLFVNSITGTQLAPYRGVALTIEGAFYRAPGTGSYTAWGAYIPGSGTFVNPVNGAVYQPSSGIIIRR